MDAFCKSGIESFVAPTSLKIIRQCAFYQCKNLKHAQLNEGLKILGSDDRPEGKKWCGVFEESALESVKFPSTLKKIEHSAFAYCEHLKEI